MIRFVTVVALVVLAFAAAARGQVHKLHGVLSQANGDFFCVRFDADRGDQWVLSAPLGSFVPGDRVYVEGTAGSTFVNCNGQVVQRLDTTVLKPGFAGVGTVVRQGNRFRLRTDDGRVYGLSNRGSFPVGSRVYVRGSVNTLSSPSTIENSVIGAAVSGFGRYVGASIADRRVKGFDGVSYTLDGVSAQLVRPGDVVYFEGIPGKASGGVTPITQATCRHAFVGTGPVALENGVKVMKSDQDVFDDTFPAAGLSGFEVGTKVYMRGVAPEDYDSGEPRNGRTIRQAHVGQGYSGVGEMIDGLFVGLLDGVVLEPEFEGDVPPLGMFTYVYGELDSSAREEVRLVGNEAGIGIRGTGVLEIGFECAPLYIGDFGVFFLESSVPIGNAVTVVGGLSGTAAPCAFTAIIDAAVTDLGPGYVNCQ